MANGSKWYERFLCSVRNGDQQRWSSFISQYLAYGEVNGRTIAPTSSRQASRYRCSGRHHSRGTIVYRVPVVEVAPYYFLAHG